MSRSKAINEEIEAADYFDRAELEEHLNDILWAEDSVTGNASGSYTCNSSEAKSYILDNIDLLRDAYEEFGDKERFADVFFAESWEEMDVAIRCYLLNQVIREVLDEIEDDLTFGGDIEEKDSDDNAA